MNNDPIEIIKNDHRKMEALFEEYEGLGDSAYVHKTTTAEELLLELEVHAEMEERFGYPRFKEAFESKDDALVEEGEAEHEVVKNLIAELKNLTPEDAQFDAKMKVLKEIVEHHVGIEEDQLLPKVEDELDEEVLSAIGDEMAAFKTARGMSVQAHEEEMLDS